MVMARLSYFTIVRGSNITYRGRLLLTTDKKERPIARNTLLLASSGCKVTLEGGNGIISFWGVDMGVELFDFGVGIGFIRLGCGGRSGD